MPLGMQAIFGEIVLVILIANMIHRKTGFCWSDHRSISKALSLPMALNSLDSNANG